MSEAIESTAEDLDAPQPGLLAAMLAVQAEAPKLPKDGTNPHFKSKFTKLETIVEKIGPILNKHGLVWFSMPSRSAQDGKPVLRYRLAHAPTGEKLEDEMDLMLARAGAQEQGSGITYARRYALVSVLNLVADEDDDGHAASTGQDMTGGSRASAKQLKFLRTLATKARVQPGELANLMRAAGAEVPAEFDDLRPFVDALTPRQASSIIDVLQEGPVPVGGSDVPADADDFTHEPAGEDPSTGIGPA